MSLPVDPIMLLSVVNLKLRDQYEKGLTIQNAQRVCKNF